MLTNDYKGELENSEEKMTPLAASGTDKPHSHQSHQALSKWPPFSETYAFLTVLFHLLYNVVTKLKAHLPGCIGPKRVF